MPTTVDKFVENLTNSGLMSAADIEAFLKDLPDRKKPADGQALAKELIRSKKLTQYQATAVYQGKIKILSFGEYEVLDKLGAGGMGVVLRARHKRMKREVAIKVLPSSAMKEAEAVQRFYREVEAAAKLNHTNIVTAYDASETNGVHYLVMEYVPGKDLSELVKAKGALSVDKAVDCIKQAAQGLQFAHDRGVVHRDIKPANLLLDQEGVVKILDMGLARINTGGIGQDDETEAAQLTRTGQMMGTVDYMPPEQAEDTASADHRADIYSLGCTLYRLLIGESPYEASTIMKRLLAHRDAAIPSMRAKRAEVPERVDQIFAKMIAKTPEERYQSMTELITELETCLQAVPAAASDSVSLGLDTNLDELPDLSQMESLAVDPLFGDPQQTAGGAAATMNSAASPLQDTTGIGESPLGQPASPLGQPAWQTQQPAKSGKGIGWNKTVLMSVGIGGGVVVLLIIALVIRTFMSSGDETGGSDITDNSNNGTTNNSDNVNSTNNSTDSDTTTTSSSASALVDQYISTDGVVLTNGRFGKAVVGRAPNKAKAPGLLAPANPEYGKLPVTVECWAKLDQKESYNILVANGPIESTSHWHILTGAENGRFYALYGGDDKGFVGSSTDEYCDGNWHYFAALLEPQRTRLYVDGREVSDRAVQPKSGRVIDGPLSFGFMKDQINGSVGAIDEVRISKGVRTISSIPTAPFQADAQTLGLWHFDSLSSDGPVVDQLSDTTGSSLAPGKFGQGLVGQEMLRGAGTKGGAQGAANSEYSNLPITVECWAKLTRHVQEDGQKRYNVIIANEGNQSASHWQIWCPQDGVIWTFTPGFEPKHAESKVDICDDQWHYLAMVLEPTRVRLYVDGKQVADQTHKAVSGTKTPGPLSFGGIVSRGENCNGVIDEVRISKGVRSITSVPTAPFLVDAQTLGLWHFDSLN